MANNIGLHHVRKATAAIHSLHARAARYRDKIEKHTGQVITAAEILGGAALAGYATGRWPDKQVMGVQAPDAAGLALLAGGVFGLAGKYDDHVVALGTGMLSGAAHRFGVAEGAKARGAVAVSGAFYGGNAFAAPRQPMGLPGAFNRADAVAAAQAEAFASQAA